METNQKARNGRKFKLTIIVNVLVLIGYLLTSVSPELVKNFENFCETLIAILFVYCGGNVGNKWINQGDGSSKPENISNKKTT